MNEMNWPEHVVKNFWSKVNYPGNDQDCWEWTAFRDRDGYGHFDKSAAHRLAWEFYNGPIPNGLLICHTCDNPPCCNPEHLVLGTNVENMLDMKNKGRAAKGSNQGTSIFTENDIKIMLTEIYNNQYQSMSEIAFYYECSVTIISNILQGKYWQHITTDIAKSFGVTLQDLKHKVTAKIGETHPGAKLTENDVRQIKTLLSLNKSKTSIATMFNISLTSIINIANGKHWKHVII